jgi:hypothetical protein
MTASADWSNANQHYLSAALALTRHSLEQYLARAQGVTEAKEQTRVLQKAAQTAQAAADAMPTPSTLDTLCLSFGLSAFERDTLLLCAGMEMDSTFASLCAAAQGDPLKTYPTFSLALAALPNPHWSALAPTAPLRRWRLIEVGTGYALSLSPLRIDERVLHYLAGVLHPDERLAGLIDPAPPADELAPSHRVLADRLVVAWSEAASSHLPVVQLCGDEAGSKRSIASAACNALELNLSLLPAHLIPPAPADLETLIRLWGREAALSASALLVECDEIDSTDTARSLAITRLIEHIHGPVIIASRERRQISQRPVITLDVRQPAASEQYALWQSALGEFGKRLNGQVETLVSQFSLNAPLIQSASAAVLGRLASGESRADDLGRLLWETCRSEARPRLDELAQRIEPAAGWDDLILPEAQRQTLREIAAHVRQRAKVYETWGFASKGARGLGISALFAGDSGTGKTMAAEVLAGELRLDLYRIDLSQVVSKYIGETEKNLRRVFDAAESGGAILLFDEADALFGKRSDVKDSHDRYANIEVSYLLQRMEAYRGLAILTTNLKSALDTAFLRRLRFVVQFPFPDAVQRAEIWERIFPANTPTADLDNARLARLNVAGGNIRNIALNAAFLAADADEPVRMAHLLRVARGEYAKLGKPLTDSEIGGWG